MLPESSQIIRVVAHYKTIIKNFFIKWETIKYFTQQHKATRHDPIYYKIWKKYNGQIQHLLIRSKHQFFRLKITYDL